MKTYEQAYTDEYPYLYIVETQAYTVSTVNENKHNKLIAQMMDKGIVEFSYSQIIKLELAGFTVIKRG
jgi:hypothetical protein